ncbi:MAG: OB-fold nucleic acid binding domain-containing protein [Desulfurococcaceae archaeon]
MSSESSREEKEGSPPSLVSIERLKPGMEDVTVRVRVLEVSKPRRIETKKGSRTIANAVVGDSTGRVDAVLWGFKATSLKQGDVVEISHAWVTVFKGRIQLNIGKNTEIKQLPQDSVPSEVPESKPGTREAGTRPRRKPFYTGRPRRSRGEEGE